MRRGLRQKSKDRKIYPVGEMNLKVVKSSEDFDEFLRILSQSSIVTFDIETNGLDPFASNALINSAQFDLSPQDESWVVPLSHRASPLKLPSIEPLTEEINSVLKLTNPYMIAHNGKFDSLWWWVKTGHKIEIDFDTMLASHLIDENRSHALKFLVQLYFDLDDYDIDAATKTGQTKDFEKLAHYGALDVFYTREIYEIQARELNTDPRLETLFYEVVMPIASMYCDIEYHGVYVDLKKLSSVRTYLETKYQDVMVELHQIRKGLNINSPKQVSDLLFNGIKLTPLDRTKTGNASTAETVLQRLSEFHHAPGLILSAREYSKQLNTFINPWGKKVDKNSRLHPTFKLHGTVTGRPSCADPNLQQVPRDKQIRSLITAPPGRVFVEADLSQAELRIVAIESGDKTMMGVFNRNGDIHSTTAEAVSGLKQKQVSSDEWSALRKKAKAVNFGFVYGMGAKKFKEYARDKYGVHLSETESEAFRTRFFNLYSGLLPWHAKQARKARAVGYVRTKLGRKRRLPEIASPDNFLRSQAERQAINSPVQGFAAELTLIAALEIHETFSRDQLNIVGTVHDAIIMEVDERECEAILPKIKHIMEHPVMLDRLGVKLPIPILSEVSVGNWGSGITWEE